MALLTSLAACGGQGNGDDDGTGGKADGDDVRFETLVGTAPRSDGLTIASVEVDGNELVVGVRYGGGCEEHDFALYWDGKLSDSAPPTARLKLWHDDGGDACEAVIGRLVRFDLGPLSEVEGEVQLAIAGFAETVRYVPGEPAGELEVGELPGAPWRVEAPVAVRIDGTILELDVRYGGGCEEHDFRLFWNGRILESHPPQVDLFLVHDDHGDACEALVGKTLRFDLARLGPGELRVWVDGYDDGVTLR